MAIPSILMLLVVAQHASSFVMPTLEQLAILESVEQEAQPAGIDNIPKRIAIIGSGITGASAASRLYEGFRFNTPADRQPSITVFERNAIVGGRITQAYAYEAMQYPVDTCAATFDNQDTCIAQSALITGLTLQQRTLLKPRVGVGIWDGGEMIAAEERFRDAVSWSEYRQDKWSEQYGVVPRQSASRVSRLRLYLSFALNVAIPNLNVANPGGERNLSKAVELAGLTEYVKSFECTRLDDPPAVTLLDPPPTVEQERRFEREIINAGARERYFANRDELNVLEFFLGFQDQFESFIQEGNIRLIERLLRLSSADVRLGAEVQKIETISENDIKLTIVPTDGGVPSTESFDTVILASPYSLANITFEPEIPNATYLEQKYLDSFVTHFTSTSRLNQSFFNQTEPMPQNILTTTEDYSNGSSTFLSLTLLRRLQPRADTTAETENLYKLVSREEIAFGEIEQYLEGSGNISWIDVQPLPRSVPVQNGPEKQGCRPILEDLELAPGLFYAGAGEQVVASADFGCRMGVNAADLVLQAARA